MNRQERQATSDALQRIKAGGSDMSKPLLMDFFLVVPSRQCCDDVVRAATEFGFTVKIEEVIGEDGSRSWDCICTKELVPSLDNVIFEEGRLQSLAKSVGGHADGFGSFGNE